MIEREKAIHLWWTAVQIVKFGAPDRQSFVCNRHASRQQWILRERKNTVKNREKILLAICYFVSFFKVNNLEQWSFFTHEQIYLVALRWLLICVHMVVILVVFKTSWNLNTIFSWKIVINATFSYFCAVQLHITQCEQSENFVNWLCDCCDIWIRRTMSEQSGFFIPGAYHNLSVLQQVFVGVKNKWMKR